MATIGTRIQLENIPADRWSDVICDAYYPMQLQYRSSATFMGHATMLSLFNIGISHFRAGPVRYELRKTDIQQSGGQDMLLAIPIRGPILISQLGKETTYVRGQMALVRADIPYSYSVSLPGVSESYVIKIDKQSLVTRLPNTARYCGTPIDVSAGLGSLLVSWILSIPRAMSGSDEVELRFLEAQLLDLLCMVLETSTAIVTINLSTRDALRRRVHQVVRANLTSSKLTPSEVAKACGVSVRYLHLLFQDTDYTISRLILQSRLIAARELLCSKRSIPISEIALRYGFCDQAHFCRQFKLMFGVSPGHYQRDLTLSPNKLGDSGKWMI